MNLLIYIGLILHFQEWVIRFFVKVGFQGSKMILIQAWRGLLLHRVTN